MPTEIIGPFTLSMERAPNPKLVEIMLGERRGGANFYIDLAIDARFAWYDWRHKVPLFEEPITEDRMLEYNARSADVFHKILQPTFKLTDSSVERLIKMLKKLAKIRDDD